MPESTLLLPTGKNLFFPPYPWEKQLQRNSRRGKTGRDRLTYESFNVLQLYNKVMCNHSEHCMARQNLLLSPCETANGKPPLMKGVGWFKESREWQDSDTLGWGEIVRISWSDRSTPTELLLSMPAQKPQLVGCYLSLKQWHSTDDRAGSSKVSDQLVSLPCKQQAHYIPSSSGDRPELWRCDHGN